LPFEDDLTVGGNTDLYRLLNPDHDVAWDYDDRRWIPKSSAFQNTSNTDRMSVILGNLLEEERRPPHDARRTKPDWYVVALTAGLVREEDQIIVADPKLEEPAHGNVIGEKNRSRRRLFASNARWIVAPALPDDLAAGPASV
jgi:hypothetical protein